MFYFLSLHLQIDCTGKTACETIFHKLHWQNSMWNNISQTALAKQPVKQYFTNCTGNKIILWNNISQTALAKQPVKQYLTDCTGKAACETIFHKLHWQSSLWNNISQTAVSSSYTLLEPPVASKMTVHKERNHRGIFGTPEEPVFNSPQCHDFPLILQESLINMASQNASDMQMANSKQVSNAGEWELVSTAHSAEPKWGVGIAQWLECQTCDQKVLGLSPGRSSGRIYFSSQGQLSVLTSILVSVPPLCYYSMCARVHACVCVCVCVCNRYECIIK